MSTPVGPPATATSGAPIPGATTGLAAGAMAGLAAGAGTAPGPTAAAATVPIAHVVRSGFIESVHHGTVVALGTSGEAAVSLGDPGAPVFARSALKPLFAVAMLRAGLDVDGHLLALAAASHSGERQHLDGVQRLLGTQDLDAGQLGNTPGTPLDELERAQWQALRRRPTRLAQNCSGTHAAMLVTCAVNGWDLPTYLDLEHPLQVRLRDAVVDLTGAPVAATGVDGCGTPVYAVPLTGLARAFGRIATGDPGSPERRVAEAMTRHPEWVGGTGRYVTELARAVPGLVVKDGAEGVCAAASAEVGALAVKVADGSTRPLRPVLAALLGGLGADAPALERFAAEPVYGHGRRVGTIEPLVVGVGVRAGRREGRRAESHWSASIPTPSPATPPPLPVAPVDNEQRWPPTGRRSAP